MAPKRKRQSPKFTKTEAIRRALDANPGAKPKELAEELTAQGYPMTAAYVSLIKNKLKKRGKPKRSKESTQRCVSIDALKAAKAFANKAGGVEEAKRLLDIIEELK